MHGISMTGYMGVSLTAPIGLSRVTVVVSLPSAPWSSPGAPHHLRLALESGISPGLALLLLLPSALCSCLAPAASEVGLEAQPQNLGKFISQSPCW